MKIYIAALLNCSHILKKQRLIEVKLREIKKKCDNRKSMIFETFNYNLNVCYYIID